MNLDKVKSEKYVISIPNAVREYYTTSESVFMLSQEVKTLNAKIAILEKENSELKKKNWYEKIFGCFHEWEFIAEHGVTYQQLKCKKCGILKIESQ